MFVGGFMGLKLFQNGRVRSLDILQYFLDDFFELREICQNMDPWTS